MNLHRLFSRLHKSGSGKILFSRKVHISILFSFLLLSFIILSFPTKPPPAQEYHIIQSLNYFDSSLPFFIFLFYTWFLLLIFLMLRGNGVSMPLLVVVFTIVALGFWMFQAPFGRSHEVYLDSKPIEINKSQGKLPLETIGFPALILLGAFLGYTTGLETSSDVIVLISTLAYALLAIMVYLWFEKNLQNKTNAAFASILLIFGDIAITKTSSFENRFWGPILIVLTLIPLSRCLTSSSYDRGSRLLASLFFIAVIMMHLPSSLFLLFSLLCIYVIFSVVHIKTKRWFLGLFTAIFLGWQLYVAVGQFSGFLIDYANYFLTEVLRGRGDPLTRIFFLESSNVGESFPLWANLTRISWIVLIFVFGFFYTTWRITKIRKHVFLENISLGGFVGVFVLSLGLIIITRGGIESLERYVFYSPLFTMPFVSTFFFKGRKRKLLLLSFFIIISFPTFIAHNNTVGLDAVQAEEIQAVKWLQRLDTSTSLIIVDPWSFYIHDYYLDISHSFLGGSAALSKEQLTDEINNFKTLLRNEGQAADYISVTKVMQLRQQRHFGITPEDDIWKPLEQEFDALNLVYMNGFVKIYKHRRALG